MVVNLTFSLTMSTTLSAAPVIQPVAPTPTAVAKVRVVKGDVHISSQGDNLKFLHKHTARYMHLHNDTHTVIIMPSI